MPSLIMLPPEGETKRPKREVREGSEEPAPKAKGKPMTDTEKTCDGDCGGDCAKCSKKGKKTMFADGFKTDSAQRGHGLKCGKSAISKGEKCHKGPATAPQMNAAKKAAASVASNPLKQVGEVALTAGILAGGFALSRSNSRRAALQRQQGEAEGRAAVREAVQSYEATRARNQAESKVINRRLNANTRQLQLTMRRARVTTRNMLSDLDKRIVERGGTPPKKRTPLNTPTLEDFGAAAQDPAAFNELMKKKDPPLFAKSKKRTGVMRRRSPYADGFMVDTAQLAI
jgi:hypothetical protein